jgi:hypothetical protein
MVIARNGRLVFVRMRDERKCAGLFGPISAFLLGLIQCLIRRLDQINGGRVPAGNRTGETHADGGAATVRVRNAKRLNSLTKRLRHLRGSIRTGPGRTTTNSSPPYRATRSPGLLTAPEIAAATCLRHSSPDVWPRASL